MLCGNQGKRSPTLSLYFFCVRLHSSMKGPLVQAEWEHVRAGWSWIYTQYSITWMQNIPYHGVMPAHLGAVQKWVIRSQMVFPCVFSNVITQLIPYRPAHLSILLWFSVNFSFQDRNVLLVFSDGLTQNISPDKTLASDSGHKKQRNS